MKEAYRVLRHGGKLIYSTWNKVETNEAIHEGRVIIESYFGDDPPIFYSVPFSMYDDRELTTITRRAGFKNITTTLVKKESVSPSASDLAKGIVEGNPVYMAILERDASLVNTIKDHVQKVLTEKFGDKNIRSPLQAWVVEAVSKKSKATMKYSLLLLFLFFIVSCSQTEKEYTTWNDYGGSNENIHYSTPNRN